ncbi:MAG: hypothetical protein ACRCYY_17885 [Trueperaceae bacterium]
MTLTRGMLELFPSEGTFTVVDAARSQEFKATVAEKRRITELGGFFKLHHLEVNDEIRIRPLEDGRYSFTPVSKKKDSSSTVGIAKFLNDLAGQGTPLSKAEIRGLYPDLPKIVDVDEILSQDDRFVLERGRWRPVAAQAKPLEDKPLEKIPNPQTAEAKERSRRATVTPYPRGVMFPGENGAAQQDAETAKDISQQHKAKDILGALGYRIESLSHGQMIAYADLGRRNYSVLVQLLQQGGQIDWATLLARKREVLTTYAAVFGDGLDLIKLSSPASLARATLWSWTGLERLQALNTSVLLSPYDLESHFERDGLFEHGMDRFEKMIDKRVAEKGAFSFMLSRLATMRAPVVFMLDEVLDDTINRENALKVLETMSQAPFHLVTKVDNGEFCLRNKISDALLNFSDYALSVKSRLPQRRLEKLQGLERETEYDVLATVGLAKAEG